MKNLKRALSLVLSAAMMVGMMVVGTSAAYADVKAEHNEEAIAMMQAAEIMTGDDKGNFNPDNKITRNEMAVVMANMLGLDTADYAGASNFADVPAWALPYVDACYANGIVSGVSATQYNGAANVTTAEAALMMLKALGYFEVAKLNDWMLDTIKMASKIELLDGIDASAKAALTRNEVAQLALNALESVMVEETSNGSNTSIKGEGFEITTNASVDRDELNAKKDKNGNEIAYATKDGKLQLIEDLFGNDFTVNTSGSTKLGLPAVVWTDEDNDVIVRAAKAADEVVVASKEITGKKLYQDKVDEDFEGTVTAKNYEKIVAGDVVYFYENGKNFDAYKVTYELMKVKEIKDATKKWDAEQGYETYVNLDDGSKVYKVYDAEFAGFDYEKGDYVLVVMGKETVDGQEVNAVYASELADTVEGKIASQKSGKYYIDGTAYENLTETAVAVKDEISAVLNKAGQIIKITEKNAAAKSDDFAYIYNVVSNEGKENEDGIKGVVSYTAYVVLADGTKATYLMAEEKNGNEIVDLEAKYEGTVQAYSINKDDEFEVEASDLLKVAKSAILSNDSKYVTATVDGKSVKVYANSKTEFVFSSWKDSKLTATTTTGIKNVEIGTPAKGETPAVKVPVTVIFDKDDLEALYVFVEAKDEGVESDAEYAVLLDKPADFSLTIDEDDNKYYTYNVAINGEEETLTFETSLVNKVAYGEIFAYIIDGDYAVVSAGEYALKDDAVAYVGEGFIEMVSAAGEFTIADDAELYVVTKDVELDGDISYEVAEASALEKDDVVKFFANKDDEITIAFIIEVND